METRWRSLVKTISWRIIATLITTVISYAWLQDWQSSVVIGLGANGLKGVVYYVHERAWNLMVWGRKPWNPEVGLGSLTSAVDSATLDRNTAPG